MSVYKNIKTEELFLPPMFFKKLRETLSSDIFPYYFIPGLQRKMGQFGTNNFKLAKDQFMLSHLLFRYEKEKSNWFRTFEPIIYFISQKYKVNELLRMKINFYTNQHKKIKYGAHIDFPNDRNKGVKSGILNFITCNGGTTINDKFYSSKANELIVFDNELEHYAITQTDAPIRIMLNINWK